MNGGGVEIEKMVGIGVPIVAEPALICLDYKGKKKRESGSGIGAGE